METIEQIDKAALSMRVAFGKMHEGGLGGVHKFSKPQPLTLQPGLSRADWDDLDIIKRKTSRGESLIVGIPQNHLSVYLCNWFSRQLTLPCWRIKPTNSAAPHEASKSEKMQTPSGFIARLYAEAELRPCFLFFDGYKPWSRNADSQSDNFLKLATKFAGLTLISMQTPGSSGIPMHRIDYCVGF